MSPSFNNGKTGNILDTSVKKLKQRGQGIVAVRIRIEGIVQGVGFRPFVHRLARKHGISGSVSNTTSGVTIEAEGEKIDISSFYADLEKLAPPAAQVQGRKIEHKELQGFSGFRVHESVHETGSSILMPPDLGTCRNCLDEFSNPEDRRYLYPFINCTDCGPRFSIIETLPYDRPSTTMKHFDMCPECLREYSEISDRRYHAQPNACFDCGPALELLPGKTAPSSDVEALSGKTFPLSDEEALEFALKRLAEGAIIAVKGLGGFHLACDASNETAVETLKGRKRREKDKPLAVMTPSLEIAREYCEISPEEENLLVSPQRPIVLLEKKQSCSLSLNISPGNRYLGVMLPYTPLHYLLFCGRPETADPKGREDETINLNRRGNETADMRRRTVEISAGGPESMSGSTGKRPLFQALVMTSANTSDEPIVKDNGEAMERLSSIADCILCHDRDIHRRTDDSVIGIINDKTGFIRRSRGYVPYPIVLDRETSAVLACGAELKNTFCLTKKNAAFLGQHIGDLKNLETYEHFRESLERFMSDFRIEPEYVACDLHPDYISTRFARDFVSKRLNGDEDRLFAVQHHHAHVASCMAENGLNETVIGAAFDGTGFGSDGTIWGGEFLIADLRDFKRVGHLEKVPLPGGDSAVMEPWRMAVSYLLHTFGEGLEIGDFPFAVNIAADKLEILSRMIGKNINTGRTSSMGRLFDAVSAMVLSRNLVTYEGQAAAELEHLADGHLTSRYEYASTERDGVIIIDNRPVIRGLVKDIERRVSPSIMSAKFHNTVVRYSADTCLVLSERTGIKKIVLSGGCFQNRYLTENLISLLEKSGLECYYHTRVPCNDGGIALGQALSANERSKHVRGDSGEGY